MELTISNLIKIIIGVLVVGVVVFGLYSFFQNYVFDFFKTNQTGNILLALIGV